MISVVPRSRWEMMIERTVSSVTTPPALRITCASPSVRPRIPYGFTRASMHVTTATPLPGGIGRSPLSNVSANRSALARSSSVTLIEPPFGQRSSAEYDERRDRRTAQNMINKIGIQGGTRGCGVARRSGVKPMLPAAGERAWDRQCARGHGRREVKPRQRHQAVQREPWSAAPLWRCCSTADLSARTASRGDDPKVDVECAPADPGKRHHSTPPPEG